VSNLEVVDEGLDNVVWWCVRISYDRWCVVILCSIDLAFEGNIQVYFFEGSFSAYEENKKERLGGDLMPKRIKYKKLVS